MPQVGFGCYQIPLKSEAYDWALKHGYRHFDTAAMYENERAVGATLRKGIESGLVKREDLFLTTKLPP